MTKLTQIAAAAILAVAGLNAVHADEAQIRKSLAEKMRGTQIGAIAKTPYAGLYEVVANGLNVFYTDDKGEIAVIGKLIDLKAGKDVSEQRTQELHTVDFAALPLDKAIVHVKGNGSRKLAVFSDPECPFCQQLEKELAGITDATIYTFLFPLAELHPDAERKAQLVWCAKDRSKAWNDLMLSGKEPTEGTKCDTPLKDISDLAQKLWITGTPGMIFSNGRLVPGSMPTKEIEKLLGLAAKS
jgi:thiol:disulfide interchange protein DsbC